MRRNNIPEKIYLPAIKVKSHTLKPWLDPAGRFHAELEDGEIVEADTLAALKTSCASKTEQAAKEVKPSVGCYLLAGHMDDRVVPATYVGQRKGEQRSWASCFMFNVGPIDKEKRENLSMHNIEARCLSPKLDLKKLAALRETAATAQKALDSFLKANAFDPTKHAEARTK